MKFVVRWTHEYARWQFPGNRSTEQETAASRPRALVRRVLWRVCGGHWSLGCADRLVGCTAQYAAGPGCPAAPAPPFDGTVRIPGWGMVLPGTHRAWAGLDRVRLGTLGQAY